MELEKGIKGNIGLFLVCAELSKRNLVVLPTFRNTRGYDLIALNPNNNKSLGLQVKCSDKKEFPVFSSYWYNYKLELNRKVLAPFIFVDISDLDNPTYYILTQCEIKCLMKNKIENYIDNYCKNNNVSKEDVEKREKEKKKES